MLKNLILNYINDLKDGGYKFIYYDELLEFIQIYFIENNLIINKTLKSKFKINLIEVIKLNDFKIWNENPLIFSLVNCNIEEYQNYVNKNNLILKERQLHNTLELFLTSINHTPKTIYHELSKTKEYLKWLNPDVISKKGELYFSFEIKRHVSLNNFRPYLFQAISNSSWANYGYLVCEKIDFDNPVLYKDLLELNHLYGIGLLKLDKESPFNSKILIESKYNSLNVKHYERLLNSNIGYKIP